MEDRYREADDIKSGPAIPLIGSNQFLAISNQRREGDKAEIGGRLECSGKRETGMEVDVESLETMSRQSPNIRELSSSLFLKLGVLAFLRETLFIFNPQRPKPCGRRIGSIKPNRLSPSFFNLCHLRRTLFLFHHHAS